jgi:hypothetical protein
MTVLADVREFIIKMSPQPYCDDCIADALRLSVRQHANHKTRELSATFGFSRRVDVCTACKNTKKVISYVRQS